MYLSILRIVLNAFFSILFIAVLRTGIIGVFYAGLITVVSTSILGFIFTRQYFGLVFDQEVLKKLLRFGLPLVPVAVFYWILGVSDRFLLVRMTNLTEAGLYTVGVKISTLMTLVVGAFQLAWGPFAYSIANKPNAKAIYSKVLNYFLILSFFVAIGLSTFAREALIILTTKDYLAGAKVVGLLAIGALAYGVFYIVGIGVNLVKRTEHIAWITGVSALVNIALNIYLIPSYGLMAAGFSTAVCFILASVLIYLVSQRYYPINYEVGKILLICFFGTVLTLVGSYLSNSNFSTSLLVVKVLLVLIFPSILFLTKIIDIKIFLNLYNMFIKKDD